MRYFKKFISILNVLALLLTLVPLWTVSAGAATTEPMEIYIPWQPNPLYEDVVDASVLEQVPVAFSLNRQTEYLDREAAADYIRQQMVLRNGSITVNITDRVYSTQEEFEAFTSELIEQAIVHTGVPNEGDYLMWQYGGFDCTGSYYIQENTGYYTLTYTIPYYTTLEQEEIVNEAVDALLNALVLDGKSDYEKLLAIYDYICANVEYDYAALKNPGEDLLTYTAYGALIENSCVCQGYANLLYRLSLEAGIDSRLIPGVSFDQNHGWNIAKLGNVYYNLDATWDAGESEYSYFLKCEEDFANHARKEDYTTAAFHASYPMSEVNYDPSQGEVLSGPCGANATWMLNHDGVLTISGEGAMDDFSTGTAPWSGYREQIVSVVVEEGVTSLGAYAFAACENLAEVMLPESLETIGTYAFAMAGLTEISIPSSVESIGSHALDCPDMTAIHASYDENGGWYYSIDGILYANGELVRVPMAYPEEALFLDSHSVAEYALSGCRNITSLTISSRAFSISANAFADLSAVTSVRFQGDPFEFDANMFSGMECTVEYPVSNTLWTDAVKQQYGGMITWKPYGTDLVAEGICGESLVFGIYGYPQDNATWKLTSDGTLTLSGTGILTHGGFGGNHPWCQIAVNDATRITRVVVEEGLTHLGALPFVACEYITEVTLPSTLTAFDQGAFYGLPRLKTMDIPKGTTVLSDFMFGGCSSLEELEIPASVTTIMESAMSECTSLSRIRFCGDAPSIHSTAFSNVTATAYYPAGKATWTTDVMQNYGGTITWVARYEMLEGDGSVVDAGEDKSLVIRAAGEIEKFEGVTVDGELVDPSNYTVTEGSTIVTFKAEYLKTLEEGDHIIQVHFADGVAIAEVSVEKPAGILGDLDLDGDVDAYDLTALARHVGGIEMVEGQSLANADVDGDGDVDAYDLTKHARYVGGIITDWDQN